MNQMVLSRYIFANSQQVPRLDMIVWLIVNAIRYAVPINSIELFIQGEIWNISNWVSSLELVILTEIFKLLIFLIKRLVEAHRKLLLLLKPAL